MTQQQQRSWASTVWDRWAGGWAWLLHPSTDRLAAEQEKGEERDCQRMPPVRSGGQQLSNMQELQQAQPCPMRPASNLSSNLRCRCAS